jgi:quercetin dioxygenase-like cupin family protein
MKRNAMMGAALGIGIAIGFASSQFIQAQPSPYATKQIFRGDLTNLPGQEVFVSASDWGPGFRLPWHMHPNGHEFAYIVEGEMTFEVDGVGTKVVKAGELIHTPPNVAHFGRNASDKLSKTVVFRVKEKGQPIMVEVKK